MGDGYEPADDGAAQAAPSRGSGPRKGLLGRLRTASWSSRSWRGTRGVLALSLAVLVTSGGIGTAVSLPAHADVLPPTITSSPTPDPGNDRTPSWRFATAATTSECSLVAPATSTPSWRPCTSATTYTAARLTVDATYRFAVREKTASNDATPTTEDYTLDTTVGLVLSPPPSPGRDRTPHWGLALENGATATCSLDGAATSPCSTGFDGDLSSAADGTHTLTVVATDAVGNQATQRSSYVLDTTAPDAPAVSGTSGDGRTTVGTWSWPTQTGDTSACVLVGPNGAGAVHPCTSPDSEPLDTDGTWHLDVTVTDAAGNTGATGRSADYRLDTVAPTAPSFTAEPASPSTDPSPVWAFSTDTSGNGSGTSTCTLTGRNGGRQPATPCSGSYTASLSGDDSWTLTVATTDAAGNRTQTTSDPYVLDTTGPDAPVVTGPTGTSNTAGVTWTWTGELPSSAQCRLLPSVGVPGPWVNCNVRSFSTTLTADGTYRSQAQLTDPLGNVGGIGTSAPYTYDSTPPATPVISGPPSPGTSSRPVFTFAVETGGSAQCRLVTASGAITVDTTDCSGGSFAPVLPADDSYRLDVTSADAAGNVSPVGHASYTLDTAAPAAPQVTAPASPGSSRTPVWQIAGDGSSTLTCQLFQDGTAVGPAPACTTSYTVDLTGQPDAAYRLDVVATDAAGNASKSSTTYVLDTTPPATPVLTGPASPGNAANPTWTFTPQAGTTATCVLDPGGAATDCSSGTFSPAVGADGAYTVELQVTDLAGNQAPLVTSSPYLSDRTAPEVPGVTGPVGPGNVTAVSWTFTAEAGTTAVCRLELNGVPGGFAPCTGGTFSPALTSDGSYVVDVQLTDAAGNLSPLGSSGAYLLDTQAPAVPVVSGPSGPGNNAAPVWTWTAETGTTAECRILRNGTVGTWTACTSGSAVGLSGDASYVLQVRLRDAAGNVSSPGSSTTYVLDTTAPDAPAVTAPASPTNAATPTWSWTAEAGTSSQCRLSRGGTLVRDWAGCPNPFTVDLSNPSTPAANDGSYVLDVRLTDSGGNTSSVGSALPFVLDTVAPAAPVVGGPSGPSASATPSVTFSGEAGTTATCRLFLGGVAQGAGGPCTSPYTPTLTTDGTWTVRVRLTDPAGNQGLAGVSPAYVFDSTPPAAPVVSPPAATGRVTKPTWTAMVEAGATTQCQLSGPGTTTRPYSPCTLPYTTDLTGGQDGTYTLAVVATDAAGNTGPAGVGSYLLDTTAPAAPVFQTAATQSGRSRSAAFPFTSESGSTVECRLDGPGLTGVYAACTSPVSLSLNPPASFPDGSYTLSARQTDAAGNTSGSSAVTYALDTTPPAAPELLTGPASPSPDRTPSWTFSSEAGSSLTCRVTGASSGTIVADTTCTSPYSVTLAPSQPDDSLTLTVRATDNVGNTGPALSSTFVLDSHAPSTADVTAPASPGNTLTPRWLISSSEGTPQCRLSKGSTLLKDWTPCPGSFVPSLSGLGDGTYSLQVRVVVGALTPSAEVLSRYVLDTTPPAGAVITPPVSPASGRHPVWSVSSTDPGVTTTCQVLGPSGVLVGQASCGVTASGTPFTVDLSRQPDGAYTLVVDDSDAAGNAGTQARSTYVLDTTPPAAVLVAGPVTPGSTASPTWRVTGDSDSQLQCRLTSPDGTTGPFTACSPATPPTPGQGQFVGALTVEGAYTLTARSVDAAGNIGPEVTSTYLYDHTAPAKPAVQVSPVGPSSVVSPTWTFPLDADATAVCELSRGAVVVVPSAPCTSPYTVDLSRPGLGDGSYDLQVTAVDAAGNASDPVVSPYVLDTTPPAAPDITGGPPARGSSTDLSWSLLAASSADTLRCRLVVNGTPGEVSTCANPQHYLLSNYTTGTFNLQVTEVDAAGNTSAPVTSSPYVLDASAPPFATVSSPGRGNASVVSFPVSLAPGDTDTAGVVCSVDAPAGTAVVTRCAIGVTTVDVSGVTQDGHVNLHVTTVDALGNAGSPVTAFYDRDTTPPAVPVVSTPFASFSQSPSATWSWPADPDAASYRCSLQRDGVTVDKISVCTSGATTALPTGKYGSYTLLVQAVDESGNVSRAGTTPFQYVPAVPVAILRSPAPGSSTAPVFTFTVPPGYSATCQLSRDGASTQPETCSSPYRADLMTLLADPTAGSYVLTVTLHDAYGFSGGKAQASYRYVPEAPKHPTGVVPPPRTGPHHPTPPPPETRPQHPASPPKAPGRAPGQANGAPSSDVNEQPSHNVLSPAPGQPAPTPPRHPVVAAPIEGQPLFGLPPGAIGNVVSQTLKKPTVPIVLLVVVVLFLVAQNRIDRRDPKLASAPVGAEPELDFGPALAGPAGWETGSTGTWDGFGNGFGQPGWEGA